MNPISLAARERGEGQILSSHSAPGHAAGVVLRAEAVRMAGTRFSGALCAAAESCSALLRSAELRSGVPSMGVTRR